MCVYVCVCTRAIRESVCSDYPHGNLGYRSLSQTKRKKYYYSFYVFEERICHVETHMLLGLVFSNKDCSVECSRVP
jgi:hypothetical protein